MELTPANDQAGTQAQFGTWVKLSGGESVEMIAHAGFDFAVIDLEHTMLSLEQAYRHIVTATSCGLAALVRVPDHGHATIQRVLDAGAAGVLVPHIDTLEQAQSAVNAVRFPPLGTRGSGGTSRAANWGLATREHYLQTGRVEAMCLVQLESERAMQNATDILSVPGVTGGLIGAADLALEMGIPNSDPRVGDLITSVLRTSTEIQRPLGWASGDAKNAQDAARRGFSFIVVSNDATMLASATTSLAAELRASLDPSTAVA